MRQDGEVSVYAGRSAEERRERRQAALLEAALELVGQGGWPALTVRGVCQRSRLTARYFYESFADREALLLALFDRVAAEAVGRVLEALPRAGVSAECKARAAIGAFVALIAEDPRRGRVLFEVAPESAPLAGRRLNILAAFAELIAGQARDFYGVPSGEEALIATTARMLAGGLAQTLMAWLNGSLAVTREQLIEDTALLFVAAGEAAAHRAARHRGSIQR